jgi:hypothetical protein
MFLNLAGATEGWTQVFIYLEYLLSSIKLLIDLLSQTLIVLKIKFDKKL